jgi:choline dehydrogenase
VSEPFAEPFDFIVVGGGSAGCVVAGRLAESGRYRVLLVEAGRKSHYPWIKIPLGTAKLFDNPNLNWCYEGEPEPGLNERRLFQPRGKLLGGTGAINGLAYVRGNRADYDGWRDLGNAGWGYSDVLPFFKANEDYEGGADAFHGTGGPMHVVDQPLRRKIGTAFVTAAASIGYRRTSDFNGQDQEGFGYLQFNYRNGQRVNPADAYLSGPDVRKWLTIVTEAHVTKVLTTDARVNGIEFERHGRISKVSARRDIILSAGAFNSPQLLQLSGIGSTELLHAHGIAVKVDLPGVGANYQDHMQLNLPFQTSSSDTINGDIGSLHRKLTMGLNYFMRRKGPMAQSGTYAAGFIRTAEGLPSPDVMLYCNLWTRKYVKTGDGGGLLDRISAFTLMACQLRPEARGTVTIRSGNWREPPAIRTNAFKSENDVQTMVRGVHALRRIAAAPELGRFILTEMAPGCDARSDDEIISYARENLYAAFHPVGTCKMGVDAQSVVDERLRVKGISGLRIADASIMPVICSGNTAAATMMIGEKAAAMILEDAKRQKP